MTTELERYYDAVRRHLTCPKPEQDRLLAETHRMVEDLLADQPDLDYDGLVAFLGEPQELAATFLDHMDPAVVEGHERKKKRRRTGLLALLLAVIAALSIFSIYVVQLKSHVNITREDDFSVTGGSETGNNN